MENNIQNNIQPELQHQETTEQAYENYSPEEQTYINYPPVMQLKTNRSFVKIVLLSIITLGIYGIVTYSSVSEDINAIASRYDGKKTMHYCLLFFVISPITLGIGTIVWMHKISVRIGNELMRRNIEYKFGASTFWLWNVLGSFIIVGPFIYLYKLIKSMNMLSENYNVNG